MIVLNADIDVFPCKTVREAFDVALGEERSAAIRARIGGLRLPAHAFLPLVGALYGEDAKQHLSSALPGLWWMDIPAGPPPPPPIPRTIGERVRQMADQGKSRKEIACVLGIGERSVYRILARTASQHDGSAA